MSIGFFTKGIDYSLPHPKIPERTILLVCKVIQRAWQLLEEDPPPGFCLKSADEDTITQMLVEIIENRLRKNSEIDGFNCALFGRVNRDPKITNFDKTHPDKMPDIFFDLKRDQMPVLNDQDGLFVECKPIDEKHPVLSCYCQKGLIRFVNGDYAWAMQDALMVGYAKAPYTFTKLASALNDDTNKPARMNAIEHTEVDQDLIYRSSHMRDFEWADNNGKACPITVSHLWLPVLFNIRKREMGGNLSKKRDLVGRCGSPGGAAC